MYPLEGNIANLSFPVDIVDIYCTKFLKTITNFINKNFIILKVNQQSYSLILLYTKIYKYDNRKFMLIISAMSNRLQISKDISVLGTTSALLLYIILSYTKLQIYKIYKLYTRNSSLTYLNKIPSY